MPIADVDADSQTRTLLDIGDGPLSIVFEMLSTPGVGICSVVAGQQTCTALRDVLANWYMRHQTHAISGKDLYTMENNLTEVMREVGKLYDSIDARMKKYAHLDRDSAKKSALVDVRKECDRLFDNLCRASGRSRAKTALLLGLNEPDGEPEKPDLLGMYELELRIKNRAIFAEWTPESKSKERFEFQVMFPTEYLGVFEMAGTYGELPHRVQEKLLAAGLVDETKECLARGRPRWISGDEDSDATVAESEDDLDIEAESEEDEAADDVAPGQVGGAAAPRVATKRVTILKLISQLMELAIRTMRELIRMQFAF